VRKWQSANFLAAYIPRNCIQIAHRSSDPEIKLALLNMAQSWLALAEQAIKNSDVLVHETLRAVRTAAATPNEAIKKD
jgi:hypothetical protein